MMSLVMKSVSHSVAITGSRTGDVSSSRPSKPMSGLTSWVYTKGALRPPLTSVLLGTEEETFRAAIPGWGHTGWSPSEVVDVYGIDNMGTLMGESHVSVMARPFAQGTFRASFWARNNSKASVLFPDQPVLVLKETKLRGKGNNSKEAMFGEFVDVSIWPSVSSIVRQVSEWESLDLINAMM